MRKFTDEHGGGWIAGVKEEKTPRHHGRWYLVFHPDGGDTPSLATPEVRWQSQASAERTIGTMSLFELRRRLAGAERRTGLPVADGAERTPWIGRTITSG